MSDPILEQLMGVFRDEAKEHLDTLSRLMRELGSESITVERLEMAMRTAHTLKGAAAMVGVEGVAAQAHQLEDLFLKWKANPDSFDLQVAGAAVDDLYKQVDVAALKTSVFPAPLANAERTSTKVESSRRSIESDASKEKQNSATVRVLTSRLDDVQASLSELVVTRSELSSLTDRQRSLREELRSLLATEQLDKSPKLKAFLRSLDSLEWPEYNAALRLERATGQLRESVRNLRLVPWGRLTAALERTVRETARSLDKEATLELVAPEVELDKGVLDALRDPLIHVLRNAVDHGIEPVSVRRAQGKPAVGRIRLSVSLDDRGVSVLVEDDGRGIDLAALRKSSTMEADGSEPTDEDLVRQIFEPGRSTADHVSAISGRGVGLDLARRNVLASGGTISAIDRGQLGGATFRLWVPVGMSLGSALLVRAGNACFSIGLEYIERTVRVPAARIENVSGRLLLRVEEGDPIPLVRLAELFGEEFSDLSRDLTLVVVTDGKLRLPVLVDAVVELREILLLPLPWNLSGLPLLRGGSVLPDGSIALALDPPALLQLPHRTGTTVAKVPPSQGKRILVVDDSHTARAMAKSALLSAGYEVELAVDGLDAWNRLAQGDFLVLVTDVQMPNLDGFELTRRVRAEPRLAHLPVILVTTRSTREDIERGLSLGADEYVVKGTLEREKLIEAVGRHA